MSGSTLLELFNSTNTIKTISASALIKYNRISGYDGNGNLLWYSNTWGGGVLTLGAEYSEQNVKFQQKK
jgi:hypothetical protein